MADLLLPKTVLVKNARYRIEMVDKAIDFGGIKARGICDGDKKEILILSKQTPRMILSTFFHELVHAMEWEYRIKLKHSQVMELEGPMADLFIKNPQMRRVAKAWRR